nr:synaptobrevin, longin-like domain protein [Tanacetum cinerariifolium]
MYQTILDLYCGEEGIDCLPNGEIFTELSRMGYEKPSTKLTFYKSFFLPQWKFFIHTMLQCMSAKRTSWNEFSSSMASAVICISTGVYQHEKGKKEIFYSRYTFFEGMIVVQEVGEGATEVNVEDVPASVAAEGTASVADDDVPAAVDESSIPLPTQPPPPSQDIPSTSQGRIIANIDADEDVILEDAKEVAVDAEIKENQVKLRLLVDAVEQSTAADTR